MRQLVSCKKHFLVDVRHESIRIYICHGFKHFIFQVLLHLCDIAYALLCKALKLSYVYVGAVYGKGGVLRQMHFLEQVVVVFCRGCELYYHRDAYMVLHDRMNLHTAFFLA